jgi:hypothetical protein
MMGVDPDHAGSASLHVTPSVLDQRTGSAVSRLRPFRNGPRHCGQFSASRARGRTSVTTTIEKRRVLMG